MGIIVNPELVVVTANCQFRVPSDVGKIRVDTWGAATTVSRGSTVLVSGPTNDKSAVIQVNPGENLTISLDNNGGHTQIWSWHHVIA